jgi:hypothetical protein
MPMSDEELHRMVEHLAKLHGVSGQEVVDTVLDHHDDDHGSLADEADDLDEPKGRRRWVGPVATLGIVAAVFVAGVMVLMHIAGTADKTGPTADATMQQLKKSIAPTPALPQTFTSKYISFSYPGAFDAVRELDNWPSTLERFAIGSKSDYHRSIMVEVEKDTAHLDDDSNYRFRTLNPDQYKPVNVRLPNGEAAVVMVKNDSTEQTLFWVHAGNCVVLSVTSDGTDDLGSYLKVVEGSLKWAS